MDDQKTIAKLGLPNIAIAVEDKIESRLKREAITILLESVADPELFPSGGEILFGQWTCKADIE